MKHIKLASVDRQISCFSHPHKKQTLLHNLGISCQKLHLRKRTRENTCCLQPQVTCLHTRLPAYTCHVPVRQTTASPPVSAPPTPACACPPDYLSTCVCPTHTCLCLSTCVCPTHTCLRACPPDYLSTCVCLPHPHLPTCLSARLPIHLCLPICTYLLQYFSITPSYVAT